MRRLPDGLGRAAVIGAVGAIWGLGLARLAAEAGLPTSLDGSGLAVAGVAILSAAIALALWSWISRPGAGKVAARGQSRWRRWTAFLPLAFPLLYVTGAVQYPLAGGVLLVGGLILAVLAVWGERVRWLPPALLGVTVLVLYVCTLLPSVGVADTFEFQVIVPLLRVAHPTGYPLYVLLGKWFTLLPVGKMAWRVNLASAVFATGAVLALYALVRRLAGHWLPALVAALAFACSSTFWSQAIVAEVYALHNLLVAAILLLVVVGQDTILSCRRRWQAIFLLIGLSFTNHLTTALLVPGVALALLWERPWLRFRDWLIAGGLLLLGLLVYLFIPLRWPALNQGQWMSLGQFASYVTGGQFHAALRLGGWRDPVRWSIVGMMLRQPFGWGGLGLAAVGVVGLTGVGCGTRMEARLQPGTCPLKRGGRRVRVLAVTGLTFLAFVLYGLDYYVPDISVFLLPAHLILAIWVAAGITTIMRIAECGMGNGDLRFAIRHSLSFIVPCFIFLLPLSLIWRNLSLVDRSHDQGGYAWGKYVLSLPLGLGSAVLCDVEKFAPLYYLQQIEGVRPDLELVLLGSEELYRADLAARVGRGQQVYLARYLPNLAGLHLASVGPLVEVVGANEEWVDEEEGGSRVGGRFGGEVRLVGADVRPDPWGRRVVHVTFDWRSERNVSGDLFVRLRLVDAGGEVCWQGDGERPVGGLYPTNAWPAGVVVSDYHEVALVPWLPHGEYVLEVGLFPPFGDVGLQVDGVGSEWLAVGTLHVAPPSGHLTPLPYERRYAFSGGEWLTGYNMPDQASTGAPFALDLSWQGVKTDREVRLAWVDVGGREAQVTVVPLTAGGVRSLHVVVAPSTPGTYTLYVALAGEAARCRWLARPAEGCPLAAVEVVAAPEGLANLEGLVLLLDAEMGRTSARPGESVPVALEWRALKAMDEDYTVFVHLIGPDGLLHGQVDAWPMAGTYPTSQWVPGKEISDSYEVPLDPGAPPGRYQVEVGWYLLATMGRLHVVNADGQPVGDAFIVGEFTVSE